MIMNQDDAATTVLRLITDAIEENNKKLVNHQNHLERLSTEIALIRNRGKDLERARFLASNATDLLRAVCERLKAISTTLDAKR
jgi:uncharacterized coiled-coil protein SlyX